MFKKNKTWKVLDSYELIDLFKFIIYNFLGYLRGFQVEINTWRHDIDWVKLS